MHRSFALRGELVEVVQKPSHKTASAYGNSHKHGREDEGTFSPVESCYSTERECHDKYGRNERDAQSAREFILCKLQANASEPGGARNDRAGDVARQKQSRGV